MSGLRQGSQEGSREGGGEAPGPFRRIFCIARGGGGFSQILLVKHLGRCLPPPRSYLPHTPSFGHPVSGPQCRVRLGWGRKVLGSCTKEGGLWVRSEGAGIRDMRFKEGTAPRMLSVSVKLVLIDGGVPSPLNPSLSLLSSLRTVCASA